MDPEGSSVSHTATHRPKPPSHNIEHPLGRPPVAGPYYAANRFGSPPAYSRPKDHRKTLKEPPRHAWALVRSLKAFYSGRVEDKVTYPGCALDLCGILVGTGVYSGRSEDNVTYWGIVRRFKKFGGGAL